MKFLAIVIIALIACASSAPTQISNNNVGDIITVGINADIHASNQVDMDIVNVIVGLINQQAAVGSLDEVATSDVSSTKTISPKLLESIKKLLSKDFNSSTA